MPVAVVGIISEYSHTYSDSNVHRLLNYSDHYFRVDHTGGINCDIGKNRQNYKTLTCERPYVVSYTSFYSRHADIPNISILHRSLIGGATWISFDTPGWDSILDYIDLRRSDTWDRIQPGVPMPPEFIYWCDAFIRILKDQLGPVVCPWQKSDG